MPAVRPLITLLTDYGDRDWFVASMKGVILSINPAANIVDLSHEIPPQRIEEAAYVLESCCHYFPKGTIHVAVVDPGVGSARRPLLASSSKYHFLAPDNGLLTRVFRNEQGVEIREVENPAYRLDAKGATFDGRDVFAPAAAWLAKGIPVSSFGHVIDDPVTFTIPQPRWEGSTLAGSIEYVDRFGNLISNVTVDHLREFRTTEGQRRLTIQVGPFTIDGLVASYSEGRSETPSALINSGGKLEIFLDSNSAAEDMRIGVGGTIRLSLSK
ncbi:MAG: SAM hydrolase/SAM-dependent halogenase family protein [Nitrospiraceae bacterium]